MRAQKQTLLRDFEDRTCPHEEVMERYIMTGEADYLIGMVRPNIAALERFTLDHLSSMPEVL